MNVRSFLLAVCICLYLALPLTSAAMHPGFFLGRASRTDLAKQGLVHAGRRIFKVKQERVGCFKDQEMRDLVGLVRFNRGFKLMTRNLCIRRCKSKGFQYAGLQAGDECSCGNSYGFYGKAPDRECNSRCIGNRFIKETCGGGWRNEIFKTGIKMPVSSPKRIGCYKDKGSSRDLPKLFNFHKRMERNYCIDFCKYKGYRYAGLQASAWCTCGNSYGRHGKAPDSQCNSRCQGNPTQRCGGAWRNEIYETGLGATK